MTGKNLKTSAVNRSVEELLLLTGRTQTSTCVIVLMLRRLSEHLCRIIKSQSMINERQNCCSGYSSLQTCKNAKNGIKSHE